MHVTNERATARVRVRSLLDLTVVVSSTLFALLRRSNMTDDEFVAAFMACRLAPEDFDHRAHLRIAWLLLRRHSLELAIEEICTGIARIALHFGAAEKFNRTLSEALVRLIARGEARAPNATFEEFLAANVALVQNVRGVLAEYYSPALLHSADAKQRFAVPDLRALP
jgi:hypothetical protein